MRILVVFCHPDKTSFASALHEAVKEGLTASGHDVMDLDLYREGFDPILGLKERAIYGDAAAYFRSFEKYANQLASAEAIVLVYPAWWYGMPAMLKGYFDKVWAPGIAYDVTADGTVDTSRLAHIRRIAVVTTYGAAWWFIRGFMGDPTRKVFVRGVRHLCGRGCPVEWHVLYNMNTPEPKRLASFIARLRSRMARW
jgi:putative NADPH-quinone reductase